MKTELKFSELVSLRKHLPIDEEIFDIFENSESIDFNKVLNSNISLKNKVWCIFNFYGFTLRKKLDLSYLLVEVVVPIYNDYFPEDNRMIDYFKAIKDFNNELISEDEFEKFMRDSFEAYVTILDDDDNAVVNCVDAIFAIGASTAYRAAKAAVKAAICSNNKSYQNAFLKVITDFINRN